MLNMYVALIPLLPLLAAAWIALRFLDPNHRGESAEEQTSFAALLAIVASLALVIAIDVDTLLAGEPPGLITLGYWLKSGVYHVNISFLIDGLALTLLNLMAVMLFLVTWFSITYLHREPGFQRFFLVLCLFSTAMLLLVTAGDILLTFVAWEFLGLSSFLLIAFRWERPIATNNALRAFITNRFGDASFILVLFLCFYWLGSSDWSLLLNTAGNTESPRLPNLQLGLITAALILPALIKSAQFPFSAWISGALEGPTPSSAVFYGSLMVHAGVYLLLRMEPLLENVSVLQWLVFFIGLLSVVYAVLSGLVQSDIKTALIFSVITQVGLMLMAIGLGWFVWATIHLLIHAIWRMYQFLHAPSFLHQTSHPIRPIPRLLQRQQKLYVAALQRFWLDPISDWFFVKPIKALSRDVQHFEEHIIDRIVGKSTQQHGFSSLSQWEQNQLQQHHPEYDTGVGRGFLGYFMQRFADISQWLEEKLILHASSHGLLGLLRQLSAYFDTIEGLLVQPRYLILFIFLTFMLIL